MEQKKKKSFGSFYAADPDRLQPIKLLPIAVVLLIGLATVRVLDIFASGDEGYFEGLRMIHIALVVTVLILTYLIDDNFATLYQRTEELKK